MAQRFLTGLAESGIDLGVDQAAAVRGVLTSGGRVETLVGRVGTDGPLVITRARLRTRGFGLRGLRYSDA